jgi:hypothetical protein
LDALLLDTPFFFFFSFCVWVSVLGFCSYGWMDGCMPELTDGIDVLYNDCV